MIHCQDTHIKPVDRNTVLIKKWLYNEVIALRGDKVIVFNPYSKHIAYVYHDTGEKCYQKYLHLIGKLVLKTEESKYFGDPIAADHATNGHPNGIPVADWVALMDAIITEIGLPSKYSWECPYT